MVDKEFLDDLAEQRAIEAIVEKGFAGRISSSKWKRYLVVAAAALVFISVGAYAAVGGGFEFFRTELEAPFIDLVTAPLEPVYAEDQGIRFEIVGVERVSSVILIYITMQDVTGENRLSIEHSPFIEIFVNDQDVSAGSRRSRMLHLDRNTNTLYFEAQVNVDFDIPDTAILDVVVERIIGLYIPQEPQYVMSRPFSANGEWQMQVEIADTYHPTLVWEDIDLPYRRAYIDHMVLSPFGVHVEGRMIGGARDVVLEVNYEPVEPWGSGCGGVPSGGVECFFSVAEPIDIAEVTAIIVRGYRIEVPE